MGILFRWRCVHIKKSGNFRKNLLWENSELWFTIWIDIFLIIFSVSFDFKYFVEIILDFIAGICTPVDFSYIIICVSWYTNSSQLKLLILVGMTHSCILPRIKWWLIMPTIPLHGKIYSIKKQVLEARKLVKNFVNVRLRFMVLFCHLTFIKSSGVSNIGFHHAISWLFCY